MDLHRLPIDDTHYLQAGEMIQFIIEMVFVSEHLKVYVYTSTPVGTWRHFDVMCPLGLLTKGNKLLASPDVLVLLKLGLL